jgi:hypothetical protein
MGNGAAMSLQTEAIAEFCQRNGHILTAGTGTRFCLNCGEPASEVLAAKPAAFSAPDLIAEANRLGLSDLEVDPTVDVAALPTDDKARKGLPVFEGLLMYFPHACLEVARVSKIGNGQHSPGEPMHWARDKSMDQYNTALRHLIDHRLGARYDVDGARHLAKAAWRVLAALQLDIEAEHAEATRSTAAE